MSKINSMKILHCTIIWVLSKKIPVENYPLYSIVCYPSTEGKMATLTNMTSHCFFDHWFRESKSSCSSIQQHFIGILMDDSHKWSILLFQHIQEPNTSHDNGSLRVFKTCEVDIQKDPTPLKSKLRNILPNSNEHKISILKNILLYCK